MEWALRWFDTLDDFALIARAWWLRRGVALRSAVLAATCLAVTFYAH